MNPKFGLLYAIGAYTCWGFFPIFWKQIDQVDAVEILMHRMVWSFVFVIALVFLIRQGSTLRSLLNQPKFLLRIGAASLLMTINWGVFIWAVNEGRIIEASMGYFINPLITVLLGVIFLKERLRGGQLLAILIMTSSVLYSVLMYGQLPWIALSLALTFAFYSLIKKTIEVSAVHGLALETALMFVPALVYLLYLSSQGQGEFGASYRTDGFLILSGLLTLVPLLLFASAARRVSMTVLGMTQYIGPTLQLLIGVVLYNEAFAGHQMISFSLIWLALLIYSLDQLRQPRHQQKNSSGKPIDLPS